MGGVSKIFGLSPILIPLCFQEIGNEINVRQDFLVIWLLGQDLFMYHSNDETRSNSGNARDAKSNLNSTAAKLTPQ